MKWKWSASLLIILFLTACGTASTQPKEDGGQLKSQSQNPENNSGWETIEVVNNRSIIAKLDQTTNDTSKRDKVVEEIKKREEFTNEPSDESAKEKLVEMSAVQEVEAMTVLPLLEEIYGGNAEFEKNGVVFFGNEATGVEPNGIWIGIKQADDKLQRFVDALQEKVDSGDILAKYIYIYYTPHTTAENNQLVDEVYKAVNEIAKQHSTPERLSLGVSVDGKTGTIEIEHNFLTKEQQQLLREKFSDRETVIKQDGRLAPKEGEPDITYPEEKYTNSLTNDGSYYVLSLSATEMLLVSAPTKDSTNTGDTIYNAIYYQYPDAQSKLKIGQRVKVESSGPIMESYPAQGTALYVDVLPEYKPDDATLSESQVIRKLLSRIGQAAVVEIREISYNKNQDEWTINYQLNDEILEITLEDTLE
ncbi:DUF3221 domain-containing protein [Robertmurraya siralis]|uniref:DUF3221 domain-containing protein n=1 Tax=Robertmurraya siralis TaxID=77777 RepID=UPI001476F0E9|nr:DUF3221 domain-containing protein [Robertmurraya siralis]